MLPKKFRPININKKYLIRIGPKGDGGYVIHKDAIKFTKQIITLGLSDNWGFEKDFVKLKRDVKIEAYDHTINNNYWLKRFCKDFIHFFLLKKIRLRKILDIFKFIDYFIFFKHHKHYKFKIGKKRKEIDLKKIFLNKNFSFSSLLKIDIEGSEYDILDQVDKISNHINTLVIELHDIHRSYNKKKINNFFLNNKNLQLIHIHGNNYAGVNYNGDPNCVELTMINKKKINIFKLVDRNVKYPIKNLDFPNFKRDNDIKLFFRS